MAQAKFIAEAANMPIVGLEKPTYFPKPSEPAFENVEITPLRHSVLTDYLEERGIPEEVSIRHCRRIDYTAHRKRYFAVGFPNMTGGYEIRSRHFKGLRAAEIHIAGKGGKCSGGGMLRVRGLHGLPLRRNTRNGKRL